jgi:flagellar basal-body rod modification protein FlgD
MITPITNTSTASTAGLATAAQKGGGLGSLGQDDFLKLMTEQLKHQDPFAPVDNQQMLAQMAEFSSLAGTTEMGETLKDIAKKLDALAASQRAFMASVGTPAASPASPSTPAIAQE